MVWIALWIVNTYSEFQVNIFNNNRDITRCQSLNANNNNDDNDDANAIAIPHVFSENSQAKNADQGHFLPCQ